MQKSIYDLFTTAEESAAELYLRTQELLDQFKDKVAQLFSDVAPIEGNPNLIVADEDGVFYTFDWNDVQSLLNADPDDQYMMDGVKLVNGVETIIPTVFRTSKEWLDLIQDEVAVCLAEADIYLASTTVDATVENIVTSLTTKLTGYGRVATDKLSAYISSLAMAVPDQAQFKAGLLQLLAGDTTADETFSYGSIGAITSASGWSLFAKDVVGTATQIFSEYLRIRNQISNFFWNQVVSILTNGTLTKLAQYALGGASYLISSTYKDHFIYTSGNKGFNVENSFVDLGVYNPSNATTDQADYLSIVDANRAIAIPTLGATYYIFMKDGVRHLGRTRHLYAPEFAEYVFSAASKDSNDLADVDFLMEGAPTPEPKAPLDDLTYVNGYYAQSGYLSARVAFLGLCLLAEDSILNRYYQDSDSTTEDNYMKVTYTYPTSLATIPTREEFIDGMMNVPSTDLGLATGAISRYLNKYVAGTINRCSHYITTATAPGSFLLVDDNMAVSSRKTQVGVLVTAAVIAGAVYLGFKGITALKTAAVTAQADLYKAMGNAATSATSLRKLYTKASILSWLTGSSVGAVASVGTSLFESAAEIAEGHDASLSDIYSAITGE